MLYNDPTAVAIRPVSKRTTAALVIEWLERGLLMAEMPSYELIERISGAKTRPFCDARVNKQTVPTNSNNEVGMAEEFRTGCPPLDRLSGRIPGENGHSCFSGQRRCIPAKKNVCSRWLSATQSLREAPALAREAPSIGSRADGSFESREHSLLV